jgi:hypothetical protein
MSGVRTISDGFRINEDEKKIKKSTKKMKTKSRKSNVPGLGQQPEYYKNDQRSIPHQRGHEGFRLIKERIC